MLLYVGGKEFHVGTKTAQLLFGEFPEHTLTSRSFDDYDPKCFRVILRQASARVLLQQPARCVIPGPLEHGVRAMAWHMGVCDLLGIQPPVVTQPLLDSAGLSNTLVPAKGHAGISLTNAVIDCSCSWTIAGESIEKMAVGVVPENFYESNCTFPTAEKGLETNDGWWLHYKRRFYETDYLFCEHKSEYIAKRIIYSEGKRPGAETTLTLTVNAAGTGTLSATAKNQASFTLARNIPLPVIPAIFFGEDAKPVTLSWANN